MYDVTGAELKLSSLIFFDCDKSGDPDCFLLRGSFEDPGNTGVADLELCALFDFLLSLSLGMSESDSESLEKSLDESFPVPDFLTSFFFVCFFFFFLSFFLSDSLLALLSFS